MRFTRYVFGFVEEALYDYALIQKKIESARDDIIAAAPLPSEGSGSAISDPTAGKVQRLISNKSLCRMEETIAAIDRALQLLTEDHLTIFQLHYTEGLRWQRVCEKMPTTRSTFFRLRRQLVRMVATQLGFEP